MSDVKEIPQGTFPYIPWDPSLDSKHACGVPSSIRTHEHWKGKKVVLFSVPGAFTPTCHASHLPPYLEKHAELKALGVDVVAVISANDLFVLSGWARFEGITDEIIAISDVNGAWSKALGEALGFEGTLDLTARGLGVRTNRYALVIDDLKVTYVGVEKEPGVSVSGVDAVLEALKK
ncbi:Redoxin [Roridomyces roridus]|uniref:Redoxin n=1 Tax=Roridomyces roridus TaxID=1738132 RepID=A0AAD7BGJ9_9AGAR|nr:Redoxin [Roridomyces roridus]